MRWSIFNREVGVHIAAGGLHQSRNASGSLGIYAWIDNDSDGGVYRLR